MIPDDVRGLARVRAAVDHADRRRGARGDALRLPRPRRGGRGRHPPAGREPARRDHRSAARLGARRDVRPRRDPAPRLRAQRPPRDREPRDAAARVPAAARHPDEADEDQIFWVAFPDEPRAEQGRVTLSGAAGPRRHARPLRARPRDALTATASPQGRARAPGGARRAWHNRPMRLRGLLLVFALLSALLPGEAGPTALRGSSAQQAVLAPSFVAIDAETATSSPPRASRMRRPIASLTKVMTALSGSSEAG